MRNIATGTDGRLPKEYETYVTDEDGRCVQCTVFNKETLRIGAFRVSSDGSIDLQNPDLSLYIPAKETLRLIMGIANLVCFSDALDQNTNETLTAIEIIARHAISHQSVNAP